MRSLRQFSLLVLSGFLWTLHGTPPRGLPPAAAQDIAEGAEPEVFDPATVIPNPGSSVARAREALDREAYAEALQVAEGAIPNERPVIQGRLRWLAAQASLGAGDEGKVREHLRILAQSGHLLSVWARVELAERVEPTAPTEAQVLVAGLHRGWAGAERALRVHARTLLATTGSDDAIQLLRRLVRDSPEDVGAASVAMPLAHALARRDDLASKVEALQLYRRVATRAPGADVGHFAEERAAEVLASLPLPKRRELATPEAEDLFIRARAFYSSMQHEKAIEAFADLAALPRVEARLACRARMMQGRALWRSRARTKTIEHMEKVASDCDLPDAKAWAHYLAARSLSSRGQYREAIQHYDSVASQTSAHRLADDAALRAALAEAETGDDAAMLRRLERLVERFPDGDMRPEALFRLAWIARRQGNHTRAVSFLSQLADDANSERDEGIEGRALYWRARSQTALGNAALALRDYETVVRRYPLAYYARLALMRVAEIDAPRAARLEDTLKRGEERLTFPLRRELNDPPFRRALELLRVGAFDQAALELHSMGALGEGADRDALWLAAALFDRAGDSPRAARLVRSRLRSFRRVPPVGRSRALWRLAYPNAFAPLIEKVAKQEGVPASFVRAIAREESSFDPKVVSHAHAYGLVQLILPTARRHAQPLGLKANPQTLREPETNLRIGTRFMSFLWKRYATNPALVPSAYNAGEGAVDRWLRERSDRSHDEWVEEIPYDETRRYTRRVLQTYGIYHWLENGSFPPATGVLPRRSTR